jgi:hypothetical protein
MLYAKEEKKGSKRSYEYLHYSTIVENTKKEVKKGRVMLNASLKKISSN